MAYSGKLGIVFQGFELVYDYYPVITLYTLVKGMTEDVIGGENLDKNFLVVDGCGILGCCAGLYWDLKLENQKIHISNIRWSRGPGYPVHKTDNRIFTVKEKDYCLEVIRLKVYCEEEFKFDFNPFFSFNV